MRLDRRGVLGAGLAAAGAALTGCAGRDGVARRGADASPPSALGQGAPGSSPAPSVPGSPTASGPATPSGLAFTPGRTLRKGSATPAYAAAVVEQLKQYLPRAGSTTHTGFPGAVVLAAVDGEVTVHAAIGEAVRFGAGPALLPAGQRVPMRPDSVFDVASVTKVFTALLALQEADRGRLDLAAPVSRYLPEFTGAGKAAVTVSMLLAHTSGLPVGVDLAAVRNAATRRATVLATPLVGGAVAGTTFRYSSAGLMVLGYLVEKLGGRPLDVLVRAGLTQPLGLRDTGFRPLSWLPADQRASRLVATDARSSRGQLRGEVHDQVADAVGGVAPHAGIFSTAWDLAVLGQSLLNGGEYAGRRILSEATVRRMLTDVNAGLPAIDAERPGRSSTHGLGVELNQPWFMGRLAGPLAFGHTGFTGTSLLVDPARRAVLVLLSNRAHPNWSWARPDPPRVTAADALAAGVPAHR